MAMHPAPNNNIAARNFGPTGKQLPKAMAHAKRQITIAPAKKKTHFVQSGITVSNSLAAATLIKLRGTNNLPNIVRENARRKLDGRSIEKVV